MPNLPYTILDMKTNTFKDFQICISIPLRAQLLNKKSHHFETYVHTLSSINL